jgi:hypothetical protein
MMNIFPEARTPDHRCPPKTGRAHFALLTVPQATLGDVLCAFRVVGAASVRRHQ